MMQALSPISLDAPEEAVSSTIGRAFEQTGFAVIEDHGIGRDLLADAWAMTEMFFAQDEADKLRFHIPGGAGARGYTPFGTEIAKDAAVHDLKEFFHVGRPDGSDLGLPANVWPRRPAGFEVSFTRLFADFDRIGRRILGFIALHLGLRRDWFDPLVANGNSVLRLLHYPPMSERDTGAVRAGAHEDINLITLLLGAEEAGLQIRLRDGTWLPIDPPTGGLVVNVGDMLQRLTNDVLRSTTHRVVNPRGEAARRSRYSMPFFLHLRSDAMIETLPQCVSPNRPNRYPEPLLANDYLDQRLVEIGLKKP